MKKQDLQDTFIIPYEKSPNREICIYKEDLKKAITTLSIISNRVCKEILEFMDKMELNGERRFTTKEIPMLLYLQQPLASHYLALLNKARIVNKEKIDKHIYCFINKERIAQLSKFIEEINHSSL